MASTGSKKKLRTPGQKAAQQNRTIRNKERQKTKRDLFAKAPDTIARRATRQQKNIAKGIPRPKSTARSNITPAGGVPALCYPANAEKATADKKKVVTTTVELVSTSFVATPTA